MLVGRRFQVLFHSGPPVLFTFPSRYWFTIGHRLVFSLGRWSSQIPTRFHVPRGTRGHPRVLRNFAYGIFTLYDRPFHAVLLSLSNPTSGPHNPRIQVLWFGLFPVRSPLLRESLFDFYSCRYLDVSIPCVRFINLCIQFMMTRYKPGRVSPFGIPRIKAC